MSDEEVYELINKKLSVKKNMEFFKEYYRYKGLTLSEGRLRKLKKLKEEQLPFSFLNHEMEKRPRLSEDCDNNTSFICSGSTVLEKESSYDSDTKNDKEGNTLDISDTYSSEEKVSCYEWDIELLDTEDKITHETCLKDRNEPTSGEISVSVINDEFDQFQEELRVREKRLKNFVSLRVDDDTINELEGMLKEMGGITEYNLCLEDI